MTESAAAKQQQRVMHHCEVVSIYHTCQKRHIQPKLRRALIANAHAQHVERFLHGMTSKQSIKRRSGCLLEIHADALQRGHAARRSQCGRVGTNLTWSAVRIHVANSATRQRRCWVRFELIEKLP